MNSTANNGHNKNKTGAKDAHFASFVFDGSNRIYVVAALLIGIVYFVALRYLFPRASFYADSFAWIDAAKFNRPISFRPIGYSKALQLFHLFSSSDGIVVAAQYISNLLANLFLFFTCCYFFRLSRAAKIVLYVLLVINPFYVLYSNYISSDAFFNAITVCWFTTLIFTVFKPTTIKIVLQLALLFVLIEFRYNALIFPAVSVIILWLSTSSFIKKGAYLLVHLAIILLVVFTTIRATKNFTGTATFSAFSGWQLANDAMHVLRFEKIDTTTISDPQVRRILVYSQSFFDTASFIPTGANSWYMWHSFSPLKKYLSMNRPRKEPYFKTWNALGPAYAKFGKTIILKQPISYFTHFVLPNTKAYFLPPSEIYDTYMSGSDTIASIACKYFNYRDNKTPPTHPFLYHTIFKFNDYLFTIVTLLLMVLIVAYVASKRYRKHSVLFNHVLLAFVLLCVLNFGFVVPLAPTVFRYHVFILTLGFPFTVLLIQSMTKRKISNC